MKNNWMKILGSIAPTLATALGGPLAGEVTRRIGEGLGMIEGDSLEDKLTNLTAADLANLKQIENDFIKDMRQLDIRLEEISAGDRDSARRREIATKDNTPRNLGLVIVAGFFGFLGLLASGVAIDDSTKQIIYIMTGALGTMTAQVGNYFFGSSTGSKDKDAIIKTLKGND